MDSSDHPIAVDLGAAVPRLRRFARVLMGGPEGADDLVVAALAGAGTGSVAGAELLTGLFERLHAAHRRTEHAGHRDADAPAVAGSGDLCARVLRLPLEEREVLVLVTVERLSYSDAARVLDLPVATVMAILARARDRLTEAQA